METLFFKSWLFAQENNGTYTEKDLIELKQEYHKFLIANRDDILTRVGTILRAGGMHHNDIERVLGPWKKIDIGDVMVGGRHQFHIIDFLMAGLFALLIYWTAGNQIETSTETIQREMATLEKPFIATMSHIANMGANLHTTETIAIVADVIGMAMKTGNTRGMIDYCESIHQAASPKKPTHQINSARKLLLRDLVSKRTKKQKRRDRNMIMHFFENFISGKLKNVWSISKDIKTINYFFLKCLPRAIFGGIVKDIQNAMDHIKDTKLYEKSATTINTATSINNIEGIEGVIPYLKDTFLFFTNVIYGTGVSQIDNSLGDLQIDVKDASLFLQKSSITLSQVNNELAKFKLSVKKISTNYQNLAYWTNIYQTYVVAFIGSIIVSIYYSMVNGYDFRFDSKLLKSCLKKPCGRLLLRDEGKAQKKRKKKKTRKANEKRKKSKREKKANEKKKKKRKESKREKKANEKRKQTRKQANEKTRKQEKKKKQTSKEKVKKKIKKKIF